MSTNFEELTEKEVTSKITKSSKTRKKSTTKKSTKKSTAKSRKKVVNEDVIQVNEEQNQTIEIPTVEEPKRSLSLPTISNSTIDKKSIDDSQVIDEVPVQKKRTIKNIKASKKAVEPETVIKEKTKKISAPVSKTAQKKSNKPKRTLRLNLGNNEVRNVDTSINQNASFFYEPSVFEKYNINITTTENEAEQPLEIIIEPIDTTNDVEQPTAQETTTEVTTSLEEVNSENSEQALSELENEIIIEIEKEINNQQIEETVSDDSNNDIINTVDTENTTEHSDEVDAEDTTEHSDVVDDTENTNSEIISENISDETTISENELLEEPVDENPEELNTLLDETSEVENNIDKKEFKEAADNVNPIEKFWNSSIPSISTTNINNTFSKIKKSIVSNISPIFKKFTYEQANLLKNINNDTDEEISNTSSNVTTIFGDSTNINTSFTPNVEPNELSISADDITNLNIPSVDTDASSVTTTESIETDNDIYAVLSTDSNIITQKTDDEVEEILKNNKKLEKASKKNSTQKNDIDVNDSDLEDQNTEISEEPNNDINSTLEDYDSFTDYSYNKTENSKTDDYNDDTFSIESYFGLDKLTDSDFENLNSSKKSSKKEKNKVSPEPEQDSTQNLETTKKSKSKNKKSDTEESAESPVITNLLESFDETVTPLSDNSSSLEDNNPSDNNNEVSEQETVENIETPISEKIDENELQELLLNDSDLTDLISEEELLDSEITNEITESISENSDAQKSESANLAENDNNTVESILSETLSTDNTNNAEIKDMFKNELLAGIISSDNQVTDTDFSSDTSNDFLKVIDCLSKAISELENASSAEQLPQEQNNPISSEETVVPSTKKKSKKSKKENQSDLPTELLSNDDSIEEGKSINILINKDDIFSISILNETYEIVADFDGISVLSENIHISTPKNNFFVKIGNKYIEIHNHKNHFIVHTNFEDVEFANAINNVGFAKKNNKIELNIKEAFKLASVNNRIELSMLNKTIASIKDTPVTQIDESSICDNKTLLISEETQKVYLPYTISEVMQKLKYNDEYQTVQEVVDKEYTVPLSTFRMPIISRFKEAYRFMRVKENSSVYAAIDLAVELMFNSNLNPAVIRAAKDLKELNIYLDCLYENEIEKFDCFKIIYKVLPKIK